MPQYWEIPGPFTVVLTPEGLASPRIEFISRRYANMVTLEGNRMSVSKDGGCQQSTNDIMFSFSEKSTDCMYLHYGDIDHIENATGETIWEPTAAHV